MRQFRQSGDGNSTPLNIAEEVDCGRRALAPELGRMKGEQVEIVWWHPVLDRAMEIEDNRMGEASIAHT